MPNGAFSRMGCASNVLTDPAAIVAAVRTNWDESIKPWVSSSLNLVIALQEWVDTGLLERAVSASISGTVSGDCLPPNVAYLAKKLTATGGRKGRGRWFHPGVPETASSVGGTLTGTSVAGVPAAFASFLTKCDEDDIELRISRSASPILWTQNAITSLVVDQKLATQRRRLRR